MVTIKGKKDKKNKMFVNIPDNISKKEYEKLNEHAKPLNPKDQEENFNKLGERVNTNRLRRVNSKDSKIPELIESQDNISKQLEKVKINWESGKMFKNKTQKAKFLKEYSSIVPLANMERDNNKIHCKLCKKSKKNNFESQSIFVEHYRNKHYWELLKELCIKYKVQFIEYSQLKLSENKQQKGKK